MRSRQSGSVFILVLGVVFGIVAIVAAVAASTRVANKARVNRLDQAKARMMAQSGLQHALSVLSGQSTTATLQTDGWATLGLSTFTQPGTIRYTMNDGTYRVQVVDACSLINVNTAASAWLTNLPLTQEQVDGLTDWRSPGQTALSDGGKDAYYNSLTKPYNAKLQALDSVDELLLVRGWTKATLYDIPTQTGGAQLTAGNVSQTPTIYSLVTVDSDAPNTGNKINVSVRGVNAANLVAAGIDVTIAGTIVSRGPYTTLGSVLTRANVPLRLAGPVVNNLTVSTVNPRPGLLNLNTVSQSVLNSIPNMTPDISAAIVQKQATGFNSLADFVALPGLTVAQAAQLVDYFCVSSESFIVRVVGTVGSTSVPLEAVVRLNGTTPSIIKTYEPPFTDMPTRWGWYDVTQDITIVDPSQVTPAQ
jgi:general secretion pathway protein K